MRRSRVNQHLIVKQCFNQQNSSHGIYYYESFTESKFDAKYVNTVKLATYQLRVFKSNQIVGTKPSKKNRLNTNQMKRVRNIQIEIWKKKAIECSKIYPGKVSVCSFCFYLYSVTVKLYLASLMRLER